MTTIYQIRTKGEKAWLDVNLVQYQACGCSECYELRTACLDITEAHGRLQQENNDLRHEVARLEPVEQTRALTEAANETLEWLAQASVSFSRIAGGDNSGPIAMALDAAGKLANLAIVGNALTDARPANGGE